MGMKYVVVLGDGMADYPVPELGNKTPLQAAKKPSIDFIARHGVVGLVRTVPENVPPGSDTANLSVMGFDPERCYTGRSPIEAVSMGVGLGDADVAYRCNLVCLSDAPRYEDKLMLDYSSDEITSAEAAELIDDVNARLLGGAAALSLNPAALEDGSAGPIRFYAGISYRHCMVWRGGGLDAACTPPHDILTRRVGDYLPSGGGGRDAEVLNILMRESYAYLSAHRVNRERVRRGKKPANSLWLWGQGRRLTLESFEKKHGVAGAVISAVDLIKGIGISAGLRVVEVEGATGVIDTNYEGKAAAALDALDNGCDFVYIHVEAPDECGHRHEIENKVRAIEYLDARLVAKILEGLDQRGGDYRIMVLPDHPTPLILRTHTKDPVPFAIYTKSAHAQNAACIGYDEAEAAKSGLFVEPGHTLMDRFLTQSP